MTSLLLSQGNAYAAQVTLAWNASDGAAGYKIYYGTVSKHYTSVVDVKNYLTYTFTDLPDGNTYYFAATAYDASYLESEYSTEVSYNAASDNLLYAGFTGYGLYKHDDTTWSQLNATAPASMVVSGTTLYANFTKYGLYKYDGTTWSQLNSAVQQTWWPPVRYCMRTSQNMASISMRLAHGHYLLMVLIRQAWWPASETLEGVSVIGFDYSPTGDLNWQIVGH